MKADVYTLCHFSTSQPHVNSPGERTSSALEPREPLCLQWLWPRTVTAWEDGHFCGVLMCGNRLQYALQEKSSGPSLAKPSENVNWHQLLLAIRIRFSGQGYRSCLPDHLMGAVLVNSTCIQQRLHRRQVSAKWTGSDPGWQFWGHWRSKFYINPGSPFKH